jgi:serine/threonine protein kinase
MIEARMQSKLGLLSEHECKLIIQQLALGVKDMYDLQIVHRDINIKNVLIHFPDLDLSEDELQ